MNRPNRTTRRNLEEELRSLPTPPPPADLLDRLRAEVPEHLGDLAARAVHEPDASAPAGSAPPARRFPLRLAASLAVASLGGLLAWQLATRPPADSPGPQIPPSTSTTGVLADASEMPSRRTSEGGEPTAVDASNRGGSEPGQSPAPATSPTSSREAPAKGSSEKAARRVREAGDPEASLHHGPAGDERRDLARKPEAPTPSLEDTARSATMAESAKRRVQAAPAEPVTAPASPPMDRGGANAAGEPLPIEARATVVGEAPATFESPRPRQEARAGVSASDARAVARASGSLEQDRLGRADEPGDRRVDDMYFRPVGTSPFVDAAKDRLSTFALDVDTGSFTLARSYLYRGALPPPEAIRVEEFVNAQRYEDPAPRRGEFTLTAEGAPSPFSPGERYRLLRFAVKAREIDAAERKSAVLTFVVDVSGSMARENRLELVKRALGMLLDELRADDRVALVVYGSRGRVLLSHTHDLGAIRDAVARLAPEGSTNAEEGLRLGYDLADRGFRSGAINRVILCSDGVANVGATGPESILRRIGDEARRGIELTTIGFGMGNYNDALMEQLANQGDGTYHYVDTLDEARRVFVENLTGTLQTVAKDAKVQVEFDPETVERWRQLGYENRDVADRDFRNDAVDAGEVGSGAAATALYEIRLREGVRGRDRVATLRLRWQSAEHGRVAEASQELTVSDLNRSFERATRDLRLATVAAELAERLKGSPHVGEGSWQDLERAARALLLDHRGDSGIAELEALVRRAASLAAQSGPADD